MKAFDRLKRQYETGVESLNKQDRGILTDVRMIGGGLVLMLVITLVITEVFDAIGGQISAGNSPFSAVTDATTSTGVAALTLLVVGFLVIAASAIMRFFGGGFGGNGR